MQTFLFLLPFSRYTSQRRKKKKEILISDNHYYFTYTHELTIEMWSLNEVQVIKKNGIEVLVVSFSFILYYWCSHANNLVSLFVRAQSWTKPFFSYSLKNFYVISSTSYFDVGTGAVRRPRCVVINRKKKFSFLFLVMDTWMKCW